MKKYNFLFLVFTICITVNGQHKDNGQGGFGYKGESGPDYWHELNQGWVLCAEGTIQSPINIDNNNIAADEISLSTEFNYKSTDLQVLNTGTTILVNYEEGSSFIVDGEIYNLKQFHFHSPSEHTVNGSHYDLELHVVHLNENEEICVVGVLINSGEHNESFGKILDQLNNDKAGQNEIIKFNAAELLPQSNSSFYYYEGSLTTPPCSEGVKWVIQKDPVTVSKTQIEKFRKIMYGNNRPVQPINERNVYEVKN